MKKIFTLFVFFAALMLVVSCGGSSKNEDKTDNGDTVNDEDTVDTEPTGDTEPAEDPDTDEDADTTPELNDDDADTEPAEDPDTDEDADTTPEPNDDDADTTPAPKPDDDSQQYCGAVFNGTSSFAIFPYNAEKTPLLYPAQWTIEVRFMQIDIHDSNGTPLVAMQNDNNEILYTLTGVSNVGGDVTFLSGGLRLESGAASVSTRGADKYLYDWHHLAFVNNGSALTLFVDGVLKKTKEYEGPAATLSNSDLWIGKLSTVIGSEQVEVTDYFEGMIDQIRFSKTARYSTDFEPVTMTVDANTVALWDFNGNTNDSSTNALNLTGTNITYTTECR
ncbi:hypothetical protein J5681_03270 [bacterium]|nr:hypothetical protein [bacterium]